MLENCLGTLQNAKGLSVMRRCCGIVVSVLLTQGPCNVGLRPGWSFCCVLGLVHGVQTRRSKLLGKPEGMMTRHPI